MAGKRAAKRALRALVAAVLGVAYYYLFLYGAVVSKLAAGVSIGELFLYGFLLILGLGAAVIVALLLWAVAAPAGEE